VIILKRYKNYDNDKQAKKHIFNKLSQPACATNFKITRQLLDCFEKAGMELRPEIDEYFAKFKN
jgi:hypothetical protein